MHMIRGWGLAAMALAVLCSGAWDRATAQSITQTYLFRDSFAPVEGTGEALVPVSNDTGTILTSGPSFVNGAFVTETISASACASTPTVRAWSFPDAGGLRFDNAMPTVVTGSYSISMLMRYNPMDGGYGRLVDFSNSTLDSGIYKYGDGVRFYPLGSFASGSFVQDQDVFVTVTRDGGTKEASLYINGVPSGTQTDTNDLYAPLATVVYFLMDNTTGSAAIGETDPGVIAYLQVRDTPMTPEQVTASLAAICQAVSCGDGLINGTEACDDGNAVSDDGCSSSCAVESCFQCSGTPSVCHATTSGAGCTPSCNGPAAATFASITCRLDALLARVQGESGLGSFQSGLAKNLAQAKARVADAEKLGTGKKARKKLQQAGKAVSAYVHRLGSLTARKKLDATLRTDLQSAGSPIAADVKALRSQL